MHEPPSISEEDLRICLREHYDLSVVSIEFLPNAQNVTAGVYRVVNTHGTSYLLKAKLPPLYEPSYVVPHYLWEQGIPFVVAPLPTRLNRLWTSVAEWTVCLYPFIAGDIGWHPAMTDAHWKATGEVLHHIHQMSLPPDGFAALRCETFDTSEYRQWIDRFEVQHLSNEAGSQAEQELHAAWKAHQTTIHTALSCVEAVADPLRKRAGPSVICHADLHPSNLIRDQNSQVFVIDWDDVMLAPKERDFLFVEEPPRTASEDTAPFFQGYGATAIDWRVLTYYRWERVVQDLIEYAREVCFHPELNETAKMHAVHNFTVNLVEGRMITAARRAATQLPANR